MIKSPSVTIAIFNYNGFDDTKKCLKTLVKTRYDNFKIWVIDDGSKKDEISLLKKQFKNFDINYFSDGLNKNFAARTNEVLKIAKSDYIMLLNNDTAVDPLWLQNLIEVVSKDKQIAVCQAKLKWMGYPNYFEYAGACGGYLDRLGYSFAKGRVMFTLEEDIGQYDQDEEIFWACGAAMLIKRNIAIKIRGFDENLYAYTEELDFCWRIKKLGYKVMIAPQSVIFHKGLGSWKKKLTKRIFLIHRNNLILLIKHLELGELIWIFPLRFLLDYASIIYYVRKGNIQYTWAVLKAHFYILTHFSEILMQRSPGKLAKKRMPLSVVFDYYFLGKKTFNQVMGLKKVDSRTLDYEKLFKKAEL